MFFFVGDVAVSNPRVKVSNGSTDLKRIFEIALKSSEMKVLELNNKK